MSNTPISTKAPTNPCCSALDPFRPSKRLQPFASYTGAPDVYNAPFKIYDGHLQDLPPDQPAMYQPEWNKSCPEYRSNLFLDQLPRDDTPSECARPPSSVWYEQNTTGFRPRRLS